MKCKNCKGYEEGFDGKPGVCKLNQVADIWNGFDKLSLNGVGYIDENFDKELSVLFVGEDFGCINFISKTQTINESIH